MPKAVIIFGSPHQQGNTKDLLDIFLTEAKEIEYDIFSVYGMNLSPCDHCNFCQSSFACKIKDDMHLVYEKIEASDIILFAAPIYFYGIPGPMKILIDRLQPYWEKRKRNFYVEEKHKKVGILFTAGAPSFPNQFLAAKMILEGAVKEIGGTCFSPVTVSGTDTSRVKEKEEQIKPEIINLLKKLE